MAFDDSPVGGSSTDALLQADHQEPCALSALEQMTLNAGRWFQALPKALQQELLSRSKVQRYRNGEVIGHRGRSACYWYGCAAGTVRISSPLVCGNRKTLSYVRAGAWFGDAGLFDEAARTTHDAHAKGATTILRIDRAAFQELLSKSFELCQRVLQLQARHIQELYDAIELAGIHAVDARLARQLLTLARRHGLTSDTVPGRTRIRLGLVQEDLAQLIGASRQRVNGALKAMQRAELVKIERSGLIICDAEGLRNLSCA